MIDSSKISLNFIKKLEYTGGYQGMRYMLRKESRDEDTVLTAYAWPEPFCFEKTDPDKKTIRDFVYTEEGLDEAYDWLCQIYEERSGEWSEARDNPYKGLF